jgi:glycosyltransferase involved in cell wall biosynthesis
MTTSQTAEVESDQAAQRTIELSIVLPCLNEAETLEVCLRKARKSLDDLGVVGEIVVADNGSTDGSQEIARSCGARVVDVPRRGYGAALTAGIAAAEGTYVLMADADDSYALEDIGGFLESLRAGNELVMGNRFQGGIEKGAMPFLHKYLGNPLLSKVGKLFFRIPVGDFHCGMRAFRRDKIMELGLRTSGMEFASEMVVRAALAHVKMAEVPTTLRPDGRSRAPHLRTWRDGWRHLRFLLAFSPRWLLFYPSMAVSVLGFLGLVWLTFGPHVIGEVGFGIQTMLAFATLFIVGLQGVGLAVMARSYAAQLGLLPPPSGRLMQRLVVTSFERGLVTGILVALAGIACFVVAVAMWGATGFGALDVVETMRLPILGMVLIVSGFQILTVGVTLSLNRIGED